MKLTNRIFALASSLVVASAISALANAKFPTVDLPVNEKPEILSEPEKDPLDKDQDKVAFMEVF